MTGIPAFPIGRLGVERRVPRGDALRVDRANGGPVVGAHRLDPHVHPRAQHPMYKKPVSAPALEQPAAAAGTLQIGEAVVRRMGIHAPDAGSQVLRRALELGVNLIDTADVYGGDNASEQMLAEALHPYPADLMIATKGGQKSVDGRPVPDARPEYLRQACERSLRALRVDTIDLYQLHSPDPEVPLEESLGALVQLRDEGKIRHIGVSNVFRELLEVALSVAPVVSVQNR